MENYKIIEKEVCTLDCHCGWHITVGGKNTADLVRLKTFLDGEWEHELGYLTDEEIPTPKGVRKWVMNELQQQYDKGYNDGLENALADNDN